LTLELYMKKVDRCIPS